MPSQRFAVNATWLKLAIMSYNIASAIKGLCFSPEERTARFKKYRLLLVHVTGRMNRNNCVMRLRLCASEQTIARISTVWEVFDLPTQASRTKPWPRAAYPLARGRRSLSATQPRSQYHCGHRHAPRTGLLRTPRAVSPSGPAKSDSHRLAPLRRQSAGLLHGPRELAAASGRVRRGFGPTAQCDQWRGALCFIGGRRLLLQVRPLRSLPLRPANR